MLAQINLVPWVLLYDFENIQLGDLPAALRAKLETLSDTQRKELAQSCKQILPSLVPLLTIYA